MQTSSELLYSSPDPLGVLSKEILNPTSPRTQQNRENLTPRKALLETNSNIHLQEFYLTTPPAPSSRGSSPTKAIAQVENPVSPWRIRVTVEAERDEPAENSLRSYNNTYQRAIERTTTTTVPLKDADDSSMDSPKKHRGRPRKSLNSPVKKAGTPKPKAAGLRKDVPVISPMEVDTKSPRKTRGRPRKKSENALDRPRSGSASAFPRVDAIATDDVHGSRVKRGGPPNSQGRNKPLRTAGIVGSNVESPIVRKAIGHNLEEQSLGMAYPKADSLKRKYSQSHDEALDKTVASKEQKQENSYVNEINDPTSQHQEFDSIIESEGFSMVSVSTLPSAKLQYNYSDGQTQHNIDETQPDSLDDTQTPLKEPLLRSEPPPLKSASVRKSPHINKLASGTPRLARVVRAGIALQGVLSPENVSGGQRKRSKIDESSAKSPKQRLDDLFSGFGAGTRRELRAGLRLGEELARRQQSRSHQATMSSQEDDIFRQAESAGRSRTPVSGETSEYSLKLPESGQGSLYPLLPNRQLPSPKSSEIGVTENQMNWNADNSGQQEREEPCELSKEQEFDKVGSLDDSMMAREAEYREERNAVIKQIEDANASQVMVIDSDNDNDDDNNSYDEENELEVGAHDDSDIWLAEARSSNIKIDSPHDLGGIISNPAIKPRRSQLPSPWRQASQPHVVGEAGSDDSSRFWQPCHATRAANTDEGQEHSFTNHRPTTSANQDDLHEETAGDYEGSNLQPESTVFSSPANSSFYSSKRVTFSAKSERIFYANPNETDDESLELSADESVDKAEFQNGSFPEERSDSRTPLDAPIAKSMAENKSKTIIAIPKHQHSSTPAPSSWISYFSSFVPTFSKSSKPKPPILLPNGKQYLPLAKSEGPVSIYTPWTIDHWNALYIHYAAWKEDRATFRLNPRSPLMKFADNHSVHKNRWWRMIEPGDLAIADVFLEDLESRGVGLQPQNGEVRICPELVFSKIFDLWVVGVMNGECEVGFGVTGLTLDGAQMWKPELEPWYKGKQQ